MMRKWKMGMVGVGLRYFNTAGQSATVLSNLKRMGYYIWEGEGGN